MSKTPVRARQAGGRVAGPASNGRARAAKAAGERRPAPSARPRGPRAAFARVPRVAWICALVAFLNATAWALITPPFQGKDEVDHFAYIAQLAERGTLPEPGGGGENEYSPEQALTMEALHYYGVRFTPFTPSLASAAEQQTLSQALHAGASTVPATTGAGIATSEPPLYYALQTIPYFLAKGNIINQLELMRLVGALFAALTALFTLLFLRELLPRAHWAATVGALCVALEPLLGFISASVNPESMVYPIAAAVFYRLARAFRRGLTVRLGIVLGVLSAVGFATKLNFIGLAGGEFAGLAWLAMREARRHGARALYAPASAFGIVVVPILIYALGKSHPTLGIATGVAHQASSSLLDEISYAWQLFLPRLPGMHHYFVGIFTTKDVWFDRSVGLYGWMDTMFPSWVDDVALVFAVAVAALCARAIFAGRGALRARLPELAVYALMAVGVLAMIGFASYSSDVIGKEAAFGEPRYLLPLLPLLGLGFVLAVRGAGRRWAPVAGAALVVLLLGYDLISQLQVIARYYG